MKFQKEAENLYKDLNLVMKDGEVFYTKSRRVYPIFEPDGSINWFNLLTGGTYWRLAMSILFIVIAIGLIWQYHGQLQWCADLVSKINERHLWDLINSPRIQLT